ncbi:MAG TPA: Sec-dependent nitrous-oxide reductase [Oscillatoriaceae cyanobacterium]
MKLGRLLLASLLLPTLAGCAVQKTEASEVYVKPGDHDQFYAFFSGGHAGQVFVYGLPSGRMLNIIPVFSNYPKTGYGFDEASKKMMGPYTWGDIHHPSLSKTNGDYDGRWLFVNDMPHARIARIDLDTFTTGAIFGPIPNISGLHAGPFVTNNTHYAFGASRFAVPMDGKYHPLDSYAQTFDGCIACMNIDQKGNLSMAYEIHMPPMDFDLASSGKGPSDGWEFFTAYNTELAHTDLEVAASQHQQDFITAVNWHAALQAVKDGNYTLVNGVKMIDPAKTPGIVYFLPTSKSPHGVDVSPDGKYICASGKLDPIVVVHSTARMLKAIADKDFDGSWRGIPVLKYADTNVAEVPVGLGPLHTQFDDKGYAYTSLFVDSAITKWQLGTWKVIDKIPVNYNIGHLAVVGGDTVHPVGHYMLALNKMTKERFLDTGPDYPTNAQLIDISGDKMRELTEWPTLGEPHYATILDAKLVHPLKYYNLADNHADGAIHSQSEAGVTRHGNQVDVRIAAIRSHFKPDNIEVKQGDHLTIHVTNIEQDTNIAHGFAIDGSNVDIEIAPGETKTVVWDADKPGVVPFYCSNFCSALHQEMQGYIAVQPR